MSKYLILILAICLSACEHQSKTTNKSETKGLAIGSSTHKPIDTDIKNDATEEPLTDDYEEFYVVIVDTNINYWYLHQKMKTLQKQFKLVIDTMGRFYNSTKDLIALPDDDEDEMFAGEYFPRRYPSCALSLEYLNYYYNPSNDKTIALVAGVFEQSASADSLLKLIVKNEPKAFKIKSEIYLGCMH